MSEKRREAVRRLVAQAHRDIESVQAVMEVGRYEVAAFLAQQAVEKYLKAAWLVVLHREYPQTHSLIDLAKPFGIPGDLEPRLMNLNLDYTVARYPDAANGIPYELYNRSIAEDKLATAKEAFRWIDSLFATTRPTTNGDS